MPNIVLTEEEATLLYRFMSAAMLNRLKDISDEENKMAHKFFDMLDDQQSTESGPSYKCTWCIPPIKMETSDELVSHVRLHHPDGPKK
jgi:hypothetical protein